MPPTPVKLTAELEFGDDCVNRDRFESLIGNKIGNISTDFSSNMLS